MAAQRFVYDFDEPSGGGRELLGGKGIGLAEMTALGLAGPGGIHDHDRRLPRLHGRRRAARGARGEVACTLGRLEEKTGKRFGDPDDPLLVSVRSGAAVSMPGMMDTILNLGLNDEAAEGLAARTGNPRFAYDSYRRLIQMFGEVVDGIDGHRFEDALTALKRDARRALDTDLSADDLAQLVETFRGIYREGRRRFPLRRDRAADARRARGLRLWGHAARAGLPAGNEIPDDIGTAVNVVQMVFGNKGDRSGTGVAFTRNPSTGARSSTASSSRMRRARTSSPGSDAPARGVDGADPCPTPIEQLLACSAGSRSTTATCRTSSSPSRTARSLMLQTRSAKRTAAAALKAAVDMVEEGMISREEARVRIDPVTLDQLLHPRIDPSAAPRSVAKGLNASPGAATAAIVFDADTAVERAKGGRVILVRDETTPDDIHGMIAAEGILTVHGGMTSHAAVVARGMGKPCVAGCDGLSLDDGIARLGGHDLREGDVITIDGGSGQVYLGELKLVPPQLNEDFETLLGWADAIAGSGCARTPTRPKTPPGRAISGRRGSASAAPSTCSSARSAFR